MIEPILGSVPKPCLLLLLAGIVSAGAACGKEPRTSLFLSEHLEVAQLERVEREGGGEGEDGEERDAEAIGEDLRISSGGRVTYHFPLPDEARLVGTGVSDGGAGAQVEIEHESGERRVLLDAPGSLDEDLSAHAGEMLRIRLSVTGPSGSSVSWQGLRIEGRRRAGAPARIARGPYNILLILFDSLRADHTAPYGSTEVRTPGVQALADAGVTFARARSSASWTRPAVAGMLTSLTPPSHGVLGYEDKLPASTPYLPEILRDAGYHTAAVVNNAMVSQAFGFARGFEEAIELFAMRDAPKRGAGPGAQAARVWARFIAPAVERAGDRPFFVYLHELDPHSPYDPPKPFGTFYDFGYEGEAQSTLEGLRRFRRHPEEVTSEDVRHLQAQYRGEITYMDRYLAGILGALDAAGLADTTVVVFVSDHGEEFWEHRSVGHGHAVYEELLRVPFLMRLDGVLPAGRRVETDVGLVDLAPTLLDLVGLEIPERMQGQSLLPDVDAKGAPTARPHFAYAAAPSSESVSFGRWKLIRDAGEEPSRFALFDLERDPREQSDVAGEHPVVAGTLAQMLRGQRGAAGASEKAGAGELPEEVLENLRALGYTE